MSEVLVYALHGFLGSGADWDSVQNTLPENIHFKTESFFSSNFKSFNFRSLTTERKIFIGYSLGGRLGLKILSQTPNEFDHYIFVSTHPGLADEDLEARKQRAALDRKWAERITTENWSAFLTEWNAQDVFKGITLNPERSVGDYDKELLKQSLIGDSLAQQPDYRQLIRQNQDRLTWVVGSEDTKFKLIADAMRDEGILQNLTVLDSGHRILSDNPHALAQIIMSVLPTRF